MKELVASFKKGFNQKTKDILTGKYLDNTPDSFVNAYAYGLGAGLKELPLAWAYSLVCTVAIFGGIGYVSDKLNQ